MEELSKSEIIREIQLVNYKSLKKLDEICKKYDIKYWIAYGTLLGAVRHKGFIPWDDDLDLGMLREDYEKLCNVPKEEWGEDCLFCDGYSSDIRHDKAFGRVYQKNTRIQSYDDVNNWRNPMDGSAWYTSFMCDVFIFDMVKDNSQWDRLYSKLKFYKILKLQPKLKRGNPKEFFTSLVKLLIYRVSRVIYKNPFLTLMTSFEKDISQLAKGDKIATYYTSDPNIYDFEDIFPLKTIQFEDMMVPVPNNYDKLLKDMYGNYMEYPPENERYHINFIFADLGNGKKYIIDPVSCSLGWQDNQQANKNC